MSAKSEKIAIHIYKITGNFRKGKNYQKFTKELIIENKQKAEEQIYSIIGSKHRVKRKEISIENIEKIAPDKITDPIIKQKIGGK